MLGLRMGTCLFPPCMWSRIPPAWPQTSPVGRAPTPLVLRGPQPGVFPINAKGPSVRWPWGGLSERGRHGPPGRDGSLRTGLWVLEGKVSQHPDSQSS